MLQKLFQNRSIILFRYLIFYMVLISILNLIKVMFLRSFIPIRLETISKSAIACFFLISCFILLIQYVGTKKIAGKYLLFGLLGIFVINIFATVIGLINGFSQKIIPDIFNSISGLTIALAFYNCNFKKEELSKCLKEFTIIFSLVYSLTLLVFIFAYIKGVPMYPALVPNGLIVVFLFFYVKKKYLPAFFTIIGLLLSMKRSIILSFLGAITYGFTVNIFGYTLRSLIVFILFFLVVLTPFLFFCAQAQGTIFEIPPIEKLNQINPFLTGSIKKDGSGMDRINEMNAALNAAAKFNYSFWIGAGNGFVYKMKNKIEKNRHNVHITPITFFTRYGIFATIIICSFFIFTAHTLLTSYHLGGENYQLFLTVYIFGLSGVLFSFSIATDFLMWSSLGIALSIKNK